MKIVWKFPKFPIQYYWKQGVINVSLFSRRFFLPVLLPLRGLRLEHLQVLRCFFISFFFFFFLLFRHDTLVGKWHHQISPPSFDLSYTRERIEGENSQKGDYTRYPFDDLDCSPSCFSRNLQRYPCLRD